MPPPPPQSVLGMGGGTHMPPPHSNLGETGTPVPPPPLHWAPMCLGGGTHGPPPHSVTGWVGTPYPIYFGGAPQLCHKCTPPALTGGGVWIILGGVNHTGGRADCTGGG